jgi:hypothetical protein
MDIKDVIWHSPWYLHPAFFVGYVLLLIAGATILFSYFDEGDEMPPLKLSSLILVLIACYMVFGCFYFFGEVSKAKVWYESKVAPYFETLPDTRAENIQIKPLERFEDNTFLAEVGFPDPFGFPIKTQMFGKMERTEGIKTPAVTYKKLDHDLGWGIDKGEYMATFYMPASEYDLLTQNEDLITNEGNYKPTFTRNEFLVALFFVTAGFLTLFYLIAFGVRLYDNISVWRYERERRDRMRSQAVAPVTIPVAQSPRTLIDPAPTLPIDPPPAKNKRKIK